MPRDLKTIRALLKSTIHSEKRTQKCILLIDALSSHIWDEIPEIIYLGDHSPVRFTSFDLSSPLFRNDN